MARMPTSDEENRMNRKTVLAVLGLMMGAGYTAADISKFVNGGGSENYSAIAGILKATRSSADNSGSQKISSPSVQIRGLRAIVNSRKQSTKKRRLA